MFSCNSKHEETERQGNRQTVHAARTFTPRTHAARELPESLRWVGRPKAAMCRPHVHEPPHEQQPGRRVRRRKSRIEREHLSHESCDFMITDITRPAWIATRTRGTRGHGALLVQLQLCDTRDPSSRFSTWQAFTSSDATL